MDRYISTFRCCILLYIYLALVNGCGRLSAQEKKFSINHVIISELSIIYPDVQNDITHREATLFFQPLLYYPEFRWKIDQKNGVDYISVCPQFPFDYASTFIFYPKKVLSWENYEKLYRVGRLEAGKVLFGLKAKKFGLRIAYESFYNNGEVLIPSFLHRAALGVQMNFHAHTFAMEYSIPIRERSRLLYYRIIPRFEYSRTIHTKKGRIKSSQIKLGYYGNIYKLKFKNLNIDPSERDKFIPTEYIQNMYIAFVF